MAFEEPTSFFREWAKSSSRNLNLPLPTAGSRRVYDISRAKQAEEGAASGTIARRRNTAYTNRSFRNRDVAVERVSSVTASTRT